MSVSVSVSVDVSVSVSVSVGVGVRVRLGDIRERGVSEGFVRGAFVMAYWIVVSLPLAYI